MKFYITLFLFSIFIFASNGQKIKYDKYGHVNSLEFKQLIQQRNYQLVSGYDTISKSPLEIVAKVVKNDEMFFLDTNGNELPYRDLLSASIKNREDRLNKPFKDVEKIYNNYINDVDLNYERFKKDNLYGLLRKKDKKVVIEPKYNSLWCYKSGIVSVKENGLYGIADTLGKIIVPIKYESIQLCMIDTIGIDRFIGYKNNLGTLLNKEGKELFSPAFSKINGYAVQGLINVSIVENGNRKMGLIDKDGKVIVEPKQSFVFYFPNSNLLITENDNLRGLITKQGKVLFETKLEYIDITADTGRILFSLNKKVGVLDREGNVLVKPIYDKIMNNANNSDYLIVGKKYFNTSGSEKYKYGVINISGKVIVPPDYDEMVKCSNYFIGKKELNFVLINGKGVIIKDLNYKNIQVINTNNVAIVNDLTGKNGVIVIDEKGNDIIKIPLKNSQIQSCGDGYFSTLEGVVNLENELVLTKKWNQITYTNKLPLRIRGVFIAESGYESSKSIDCFDLYGNRYAEKKLKN
ncbi:WG repeat-containing protein [Flavobacterium branchiicola]|uniref:WG repeat-containing protein n=1 Tax=Flavobacterium branchiicola TaxID=1114875 RepID=A0ABV9PBX7_9FLAO|nr:WG repeat-containing protein [Flavobacterium branchiicola]MBS7253469.1 WG repeat-containing protein [Flavobacterium branchiicola]